VIGVPHGTYAYDPMARTLVELQRGHHGQALVHLGLGQEIFQHAAAAIIHTVDLVRAIERFGDRVYRSLSLDAGHIGERLNLALLREGLGVSGCGGYYDDEMNRVLGIPESQAVLYITSVGVPASES
jgi:SagB-type dehydrogenase family enzyme